MPARAYWNPADGKQGFREKFEIKYHSKEITLIVPQQFLDEVGTPFDVRGSFSEPK